MNFPAVRAVLTIWPSVGESAVCCIAALPMVQPNDKALPRSAAGAVMTTRPGAATKALDDAMDRYAQGDDGAFDELHRQGAPRLRGFLTRLCGNVALADDLVQEAFLRIHLARGNFMAKAAALPWMLAIARNAFLDHARRENVRRSAREQASLAKAGLDHEAPPGTRGDEVLAARETMEIVRRTLDQIPMMQREAFVLLRFEGLSVGEAAQVLGATEAAVKVRAFRAYEALRSALHGEGEKGGESTSRSHK
jgi:RNA polymerase sigma-70 factor, ECF subfamily